MPHTISLADFMFHFHCSKLPTKRAHNVPRTLWNVGLNDSLVNVKKNMPTTFEINTYFTSLYLRCHNVMQ